MQYIAAGVQNYLGRSLVIIRKNWTKKGGAPVLIGTRIHPHSSIQSETEWKQDQKTAFNIIVAFPQQWKGKVQKTARKIKFRIRCSKYKVHLCLTVRIIALCNFIVWGIGPVIFSDNHKTRTEMIAWINRGRVRYQFPSPMIIKPFQYTTTTNASTNMFLAIR